MFLVQSLLPHLCLSGERLFPPPSGLSYSTWFCVERFSSAPQAHPVRLLTMVRRATSSEQHYVCLAVALSTKDRLLTVSTKEELLQTHCEDRPSRIIELTSFHCGQSEGLHLHQPVRLPPSLSATVKQRMSPAKKPPSTRSCPAVLASAVLI